MAKVFKISYVFDGGIVHHEGCEEYRGALLLRNKLVKMESVLSSLTELGLQMFRGGFAL